MESLDDAEEEDNTDTSMLMYESDDLSLNWELPVRKTTSTRQFRSHQLLRVCTKTFSS